MKDLPLNALRAFAAVYQHGGIRSAARRLGIAHSSVSRHVAELESWLGAPLIRDLKGRRGLTFTARGESLGKTVSSCFNNLQRATDGLRESRGSQSVTLAVPSSFAVRWLLPRLPNFEIALPHIELSLIADPRRSLVISNEVDLGIWMGAGPWPGIRRRPLLNDQLYPVLSPRLWQRRRCPSTVGGLKGLRLLHDRDPQTTWAAWRDEHGPANLDIHSGPRFTSSDLVLRAAAQGHGVALARHQLAVDDVNAEILVRPIPRLCVQLGTSYWIVEPKQVASRPETIQVVKWLLGQAEGSSGEGDGRP